jgi:acetyl esterase/lipase
MKKICLPIIAALLVVCCVNTTSFCQESNRGEDYSAYLPEVIQINHFIGKMPQGASVLTKDGLAAARNGMAGVFSIPGPGGDITLRIFRPDTILAVVLDIHGGGWFQGSAAVDDALNDQMARACKVAVVSVEYRLAPESPFPACIDDCKAAAKWLVANAQAEFGTGKLFVSGQSAGGHLSALVAIYMRDSLNAAGMLRGAVLQYGCYDLSRSPSQRQATDSTLILSKKGMADNFVLVFGGWDGEKLRQPEYSPLYANLKGLPPAYFMVGTIDPLLDDTNFMESRWRSAGNKTYLAVYPQCAHGFNVFPMKLAKLANEKMFEWVRARIAQ